MYRLQGRVVGQEQRPVVFEASRVLLMWAQQRPRRRGRTPRRQPDAHCGAREHGRRPRARVDCHRAISHLLPEEEVAVYDYILQTLTRDVQMSRAQPQTTIAAGGIRRCMSHTPLLPTCDIHTHKGAALSTQFWVKPDLTTPGLSKSNRIGHVFHRTWPDIGSRCRESDPANRGHARLAPMTQH